MDKTDLKFYETPACEVVKFEVEAKLIHNQLKMRFRIVRLWKRKF